MIIINSSSQGLAQTGRHKISVLEYVYIYAVIDIDMQTIVIGMHSSLDTVIWFPAARLAWQLPNQFRIY